MSNVFNNATKTGIDANMSITTLNNKKEIIRVKSTGASGLGGIPTKGSSAQVNTYDDSYGHQVTAELNKALSKNK